MVKRFSKEVHLSEYDNGIYVLYEDYKKMEERFNILLTTVSKYIQQRSNEEDDHK